MESSGGFEVHCCSFFVEIRTPVRRVLSVAGASSGAGRKGNQMGRSGGV